MRSKFDSFVVTTPILLMLLWLVGLHVSDIARILLVIFGVLYIFKKPRTDLLSLTGTWWSRCVSAFLVVFVLFTFTQPLFETLLGQHGIDFAIFTQVIDSVSRRGAPLSSLIGIGWKNFLSHHFTPIFYFPGILGYFGIPAFVSASMFHSLAIGAGGLSLFLSAKKLQLPRQFALAFVAMLFATPTFRHATLFGIHDELFALPFLGFAFYFWISARHLAMAFCLIGASLTKESMFPVVTAFALMTILDPYLNKQEQIQMKDHKIALEW